MTVADFGSKSATFGSLTAAVVRGKVVTLNALWQSFPMGSVCLWGMAYGGIAHDNAPSGYRGVWLGPDANVSM